MAQSVLSVRMDGETKEAFAAFCEQVGMSVSTAINLFARQTIRERRIPFVVSLDSVKPGQNLPLALSAVTKAVKEAAGAFPAIRKVVLFGSYARGEANASSDIDLRIVYDEGSRFSAMNLAAFAHKIEAATGKPVDVISRRAIGNVELEAAIRADGMVVYERQKQ